jgi:predicted AAA+ superfamily ATPase
MIHKLVHKNVIMLAYEDFNSFKIFMVDVGLLAAMAKVDVQTLIEGNTIFQEFKGALTEQYVLQQLITQKDIDIFYWSPGNSLAEIDFLLQRAGEIIPMEVKAEENLQSKSLRVFSEKYHSKTVIRTSMANYRQESWMCNIPLYAVSFLS